MWHEYQYFCSQGYGVVYSNPRGSGGYGQQFLQANINDWGTGPSSDVLTALDKALHKAGLIPRS
jgi:dipeptidyl aminopeptidase/acylaminoacyl peptidase